MVVLVADSCCLVSSVSSMIHLKYACNQDVLFLQFLVSSVIQTRCLMSVFDLCCL